MPQTNPIDDYMSKAEFCSALKINPRTADRWRLRRIGPKVTKIGPRRIFYRRSDVAAWLESQAENTVRV